MVRAALRLGIIALLHLVVVLVIIVCISISNSAPPMYIHTRKDKQHEVNDKHHKPDQSSHNGYGRVDLESGIICYIALFVTVLELAVAGIQC